MRVDSSVARIREKECGLEFERAFGLRIDHANAGNFARGADRRSGCEPRCMDGW